MGRQTSATIQNCVRSKNGLNSRTPSHNLERKLQALDPFSYLNPRKRALEEVRGFSQLFSVDCSSSSSDNNNTNEEEKSVTLQQRKRQFPDGNNGDHHRGRQYGWFAEDQGQSMSYNDFLSNNHVESVSAIDSLRHRENASDPAQKMPESGSQTPARGRLLGSNPRVSLPMGEIVEVEGGHIVRSTGRKDRHSKVYTAKGPRDRRVRLSASTAIQFYDLQDRLGYDRPSKAVAWLIEKAKASIDELDRLPEIRPPLNNPPSDSKPRKTYQDHEQETEAQSTAQIANNPPSFRDDHSRAVARERARERAKERTQEREKAAVDNNNNNNTTANNNNNIQFSFLNFYSNASNLNSTHSLIQALQLQNSAPSKGFTTVQNSQAFNPMNVSINPSDSNPQLQVSQLQQQQQAFYQPLSSQNFSSQFETPGVVFCEAENSSIVRNHQTQQGLFSGSAYQVPTAPFVRDLTTSEHHNEFGNKQPPQRIFRTHPWTNNNNNNNCLNSRDFGPFGSDVGLNIGNNGQLHQNSYSIRGTLQSSSSPVRVRPLSLAHDFTAATTDNLLQNHTTAAAISIPFAASGGGGFSSFRIPARIQGIDEHDDVKPSASSSTSQM